LFPAGIHQKISAAMIPQATYILSMIVDNADILPHVQVVYYPIFDQFWYRKHIPALLVKEGRFSFTPAACPNGASRVG
jgi:hypothetical protein